MSATASTLPNLDEIIGPDSSEETTTSTTRNKRPAAEYWLNVGIVRNGKLCSLPMGIPLDNLKAKPVPNINITPDMSPEQVTRKKDFRALRATEAELWEKFRAIFLSLKPGEEREVNLVCRVRRTEAKSQNEELEQEGNPYALGDDFQL